MKVTDSEKKVSFNNTVVVHNYMLSDEEIMLKRDAICDISFRAYEYKIAYNMNMLHTMYNSFEEFVQVESTIDNKRLISN